MARYWVVASHCGGSGGVAVVTLWWWCRDSLLYKGSEDDEGLELEVTGWAWNRRTKTRTMMIATRMRVKGSMVAVRLRLVG